MKEKKPDYPADRQKNADSSPISYETKPGVMKTMRDQAVMGDRANMTSDFGIAGLMASLSDIESSINTGGRRDGPCEKPRTEG